jgi:peptidoglycan hydrolase-like protein with peptidoglycan-binding domain
MTSLDTHDEIFAALRSLGFDSYTFDGAVMAFQYAHKLEVNGVVDAETKKAIKLALACS